MHSFMKSITRTARCGAMYRDRLLREDGLNGNQHVYITNICKNPGISQEQLSRTIFVNKSNVTRQLALLEQNGFITREPKQGDKRVLQIYPTKKALLLYPKVRGVMQDWSAYLLADFSEPQREQLREMLSLVLDRAMQAVQLEDEGGSEL